MRTGHESLYEEAPPTLTLAELISELTQNMHLQASKMIAWSVWVQNHVGADVNVDAQVFRQMLRSDFESSCTAAQLTEYEALQIRTCLGSVDTPCTFATSSALVLGEGQSLEKKSKKGGATNEAAEVLKERRPKMQPGQYFPPACFDVHRLHAPTRDEAQLRKLIVQEVRHTNLDTHSTRVQSTLIPMRPPPQECLFPLFR